MSQHITGTTAHSAAQSVPSRAALGQLTASAALPSGDTLGALGILGIGCDLVHIPSFTEQCTTAGSHFARIFTALEIRYAHRKCTGSPFNPAQASLWGSHLAARWAAREAFIKAWSGALLGQAPVIADSPDLMAGISVTADQWGRPTLHLVPWVARAFQDSLPNAHTLLSLSHDGGYAMAVIVLTTGGDAPNPADPQRERPDLHPHSLLTRE